MSLYDPNWELCMRAIGDKHDEIVALQRRVGELERRLISVRIILGTAIGTLTSGQEPVRGKEWREIAERAYRATGGTS